ncbi:MAG: chloride channel protein [Thermodesulfobacteriota bacterium]|nr:chloride channel protein [Thermodesulfobacteriota bacterium]
MGSHRIIKLKESEEYSVRPWVTICALAIVTGLGGGVGAVLFRKMIDFFEWIFFSVVLSQTSILTLYGYNLGIIMLPVLCGLIIGPIILYFCPETKGHGVPEVMEAVHLQEGRIRKRVTAVKIFVSAATIGSGGSAGREGPIAQIGGSLGSTLAQLFKVDRERSQLLTACGVAAGIAGTFNAPLGGAFFGLEIILRRYKFKYIIPILIASSMGSWTTAAIIGNRPAFQTTLFTLNFHQIELLLFIIFGIAFGVISFLWVTCFYFIEGLFDRLKRIPDIFKPAIGMSIAGIIGCILARHCTQTLQIDFVSKYYGIMGAGYQGMDLALMGKLSLTMLLLLGVLKIIATSFTIGSGGSGGVFSPTLYIGTMFGLAIGYISQGIFPAIVTEPQVYGVIGMAALFAGTAKAPLTVIFQTPEMTRSFGLIPGLMIACGFSYIVANILLHGSSIYTLKLERRGTELREGRIFKVKDAVKRKEKIEMVTEDMPLKEILKLVTNTNHFSYPMINRKEELSGVIRFNDIRRVLLEEEVYDLIIAKDIADSDLLTVTLEDRIEDALQKFILKDVTEIPVVKEGDPKTFLTMLSRKDLLAIYDQEMQEREWD